MRFTLKMETKNCQLIAGHATDEITQKWTCNDYIVKTTVYFNYIKTYKSTLKKESKKL